MTQPPTHGPAPRGHTLPGAPAETQTESARDHAQERVYDVIGVGLGPFNLGLAALAEPVDGLDVLVLEQRDEFRWHPGLLIEGTTLQVPFLADLVTMADPTSKYSFLNHLKQVGRLYPFYIRESFYPLRAEYDAYCRWVAERLPGIRFGYAVTGIERVGDRPEYVVTAAGPAGVTRRFRARHVVLGVGTDPTIPAELAAARLAHPGHVLHSGEYLPHRDRLQELGSVTVVGSGQSAAEIYRDLLGTLDLRTQRLDWMTRSPRFAPMEYTKLTLEMTSPEYSRYFHGLPMPERDRLSSQNRLLYKGISATLVDEIFDALYARRVELELARERDTSYPETLPTALHTACALTGMGDAPGGDRPLTLRWHHTETGADFTTTTDAVILSTGYGARLPACVQPLQEHLNFDERGRYAVALDFSVDNARTVFVQNAEEHTHGLSAPDLGMGAWRNAQIINAVAGRTVYAVEQQIAFQTFGAPA